MKIHPGVVKLFLADRQSDRYDKTNNHFCNFMSAPKRIYHIFWQPVCVTLYFLNPEQY